MILPPRCGGCMGANSRAWQAVQPAPARACLSGRTRRAIPAGFRFHASRRRQAGRQRLRSYPHRLPDSPLEEPPPGSLRRHGGPEGEAEQAAGPSISSRHGRQFSWELVQFALHDLQRLKRLSKLLNASSGKGLLNCRRSDCSAYSGVTKDPGKRGSNCFGFGVRT